MTCYCNECEAKRVLEIKTRPAPELAETSPERAQLQVSLLNEIGLTLTAVAKQAKADGVIAGQRYGALLDWSEANGKGLSNLFELVAEQAETLKTYKLSLEGIQGLLVDLDAKVSNCFDLVMTNQEQMNRGLATRLAQIEERLEANEKQAVGRYERLLMLISVLHDAGPKPRKAGKRKDKRK